MAVLGGEPLRHPAGPGGPPPRDALGEKFQDSASRLAGFAGAYLGWAPDDFWRATPAELLTVVAALRGDAGDAPPDAATMARLREAFPDG
jgi:uncharacterized phage protein (TIGR02216 family)